MDWSRETLGLIWIGVAIAAGVVEIFTVDLIFLMIALGALAGAAAAFTTGSLTLSIIAMAIATPALLLAVRPPLRRYLNRNVPEIAMHTDALVGRSATVTEPVDGNSDDGRVKLAGEIWSARLETGDEPVATGTEVRVVHIDGAIAVVTPIPPTAAR